MSQLLVLALLLACVCTVRAEERVLAYDIDVEVRADGALDVTERITVNVEGNRIRRGIYRDFPTRYRDRYGNRVVVGLQVLGVERDGANEPWFTENLGNGVRINTGDDSFLPAPAEHTFTLRYRTTRQLGFFGDHDELYWNAIGTGWIFPILSGTVTARLPVPVPVAQMSAEGYTGPQGAKGQAYAAELPDAGTARWHLTQPLAPGEGLTVVLTFPKGIVAAPTTQQRLFWFLRDNRGVLMATIGWLLLLAFCVYEWRRVGRDPRKGIVIARYEPPEGHGPANLRYLQRMGYDTRCFSAAVLNLAVAGFMRISREPRLIKKDEWRLERGAAGTKPPAPSEAGLLDALFVRSTAGAVDLNNKQRARGGRPEQQECQPAAAGDRRAQCSAASRDAAALFQVERLEHRQGRAHRRGGIPDRIDGLRRRGSDRHRRHRCAVRRDIDRVRLPGARADDRRPQAHG